MCLQFKKKRQGYHVTFLACFSSLRITVLCCFQHLKIVSFFPQFTASPWQIIETGVLFLKQNYKHKRKWIIHFQIPSQYSNFFEKINWINICLASFLSSFRLLFTFYLIRGVELVRGSSLTYPLWWDEIWTEKEERKQGKFNMYLAPLGTRHPAGLFDVESTVILTPEDGTIVMPTLEIVKLSIQEER